MKFHLNYIPKKPGFQINHQDSIMLIGSCFAENIGNFLADFKFKTHLNPNGILFNPISIYNCLHKAIHLKKYDKDLVIERNDQFYSFSHHSSISAGTESGLLETVNLQSKAAHNFLRTADFLIITFGSAFIYHHKSSGQVVANCHKQNADVFDKKLLEVKEITDLYAQLITDIKNLNPRIKIIFTLSPVKYLKDGIEENNLSKSTLLLSIHKIMAQHPECFYFPAFELLNDDLRDHRFYKEDLAHPNEQAINYIWQKFSECFFNTKTLELNQQIHKLNLALSHRQMQEKGPEIAKLKDFIEKQKTEITKLEPEIKFE
jgi:hypothetical protein